MQMIHAGGIAAVTDAQRSHDEDNPRGYFEFERVKQLKSDQTWLDEAAGKVVKVIHLLLVELPDDRAYRVIFMERDLREVIKSQSIMLARRGRPGARLPPESLIAIYEQQLKVVERWLAERPNFQVLRVPYAELVAQPTTLIPQINTFLGGTMNEEQMGAAVDPSLHRNKI
jgi:hypothetical protein